MQRVSTSLPPFLHWILRSFSPSAQLLALCAVSITASSILVALLIKFALVLGGSNGLKRTLRQRHCPPELVKRHAEKIATPATGGIWMLLAQLIIFCSLMDRKDLNSWILLLASLGFGAAGAWDDFAKLRHRQARAKRSDVPIRDFSARAKFIAQALLAFALLIPLTSARFHKDLASFVDGMSSKEQSLKECGSNIQSDESIDSPIDEDLKSVCSNFYLPLKKAAVFHIKGWQRLLSLLFFAFVVIGSSNAVNLTDGLDGLAGGTALLVSIALMGGAFCSGDEKIAAMLHLPHIVGARQVAIYLSSVAGGLIGFLLFNHHPARIFMGDVGSLSLGAALGFAAILIRQEWLLACSGAVLVAETLSVILQVASYRFRRGKRIFLCTPLHHHFECLGWDERRVVRRFWLVSFISSALGFLLMLHPRS